MQINQQTFFSPYASPTPLLACFTDSNEEQANQACPIVLYFSNLSYTVKINNKLSWWNVFPCCRNEMIIKEPAQTRVILNDISGEAKQGQILGVLGPSGSGKSTLIDALANRISRESLKGMITINGQPILDSNLLKVISAYVTQDDLLFPMLTVEETITFAAELRLPKSVTRFDKKKRVQDLIHQLDLSNAAQTVIGDEGHRGVSGGERRRVSIAIEIIHDPLLLLLDEPTSGLDSTSAFTVVKVLNRLARTGTMVIMSIHQPSFRILGLLDNLLILSHGNTVYGGSPSDLPMYMDSLGHPIPSDENPAEAIMDLISDLEDCEDGINKMVDFNRTWQENRAMIYRGSNSNLDATKTEVQKFTNPCWAEIPVLAKRSFLNSFRMAEIFLGRIGAIWITGFILASLYWNVDTLSKGSEERIRALAFITASIFFLCGDGSAIIFLEKNIMLRETSRNVYRKLSYLLSDALTWMPSLLFISITYSALTFWGIGFSADITGFAAYFAVVFAAFWAGNSYVVFIAGLVPNAILGFVLLTATLGHFLIFSGVFMGRDDIPAYWIWSYYLSPKKYAYSAFLQNEFEDPARCFTRAIEKFDYTLLGGVPVELKEKLLRGFGEVVGYSITGSTCMTAGADRLKQVGATDLSKWECFWIIIAWGLLFRVLFYVTLLLSGSKMKRK